MRSLIMQNYYLHEDIGRDLERESPSFRPAIVVSVNELGGNASVRRRHCGMK